MRIATRVTILCLIVAGATALAAARTDAPDARGMRFGAAPAQSLGAMTFGPDGNLLAFVPGDVLRFDGTTGASLGSFIPAGDPHPGSQNGFLTFGPDGNLYLTDFDNDRVLRYDGTTGEFVDSFASGGGLDGPRGLVFVPEPGAATLPPTVGGGEPPPRDLSHRGLSDLDSAHAADRFTPLFVLSAPIRSWQFGLARLESASRAWPREPHSSSGRGTKVCAAIRS